MPVCFLTCTCVCVCVCVCMGECLGVEMCVCVSVCVCVCVCVWAHEVRFNYWPECDVISQPSFPPPPHLLDVYYSLGFHIFLSPLDIFLSPLPAHRHKTRDEVQRRKWFSQMCIFLKENSALFKVVKLACSIVLLSSTNYLSSTF